MQGKGGEFSSEAPDGISMPMIDGWGEDHTVRIDWGDGSATTEGNLAEDPATGENWFTITGDHAYEQAGSFEGNVCATDGAGLSNCFPFFAEVANAAPVVDPGPDRSTSAEVSLGDVTFQDPGRRSTPTPRRWTGTPPTRWAPRPWGWPRPVVGAPSTPPTPTPPTARARSRCA